MITKSRLEELIKQGATVYYADRDVRFFIPIFLNKDFMIKGKELSHKENCVKDTLLEDLYETEEQAEWASKYQRIPRTEYLDLPTWEELIDKKKNRRFYINEFVCRNEYDLLVVCSLGVDFEGKIEVRNVSLNHKLLFQAPLSEENYEKACDLCVKLFKGESDENRDKV